MSVVNESALVNPVSSMLRQSWPLVVLQTRWCPGLGGAVISVESSTAYTGSSSSRGPTVSLSGATAASSSRLFNRCALRGGAFPYIRYTYPAFTILQSFCGRCFSLSSLQRSALCLLSTSRTQAVLCSLFATPAASVTHRHGCLLIIHNLKFFQSSRLRAVFSMEAHKF